MLLEVADAEVSSWCGLPGRGAASSGCSAHGEWCRCCAGHLPVLADCQGGGPCQVNPGVHRVAPDRSQVQRRFDGQPTGGPTVGRVGVLPSTGAGMPRHRAARGGPWSRGPRYYASFPFTRRIRLPRRIRAAIVAIFLRVSHILRDNYRMLEFRCENCGRGVEAAPGPAGQHGECAAGPTTTSAGAAAQVHDGVKGQPAARSGGRTVGVLRSIGTLSQDCSYRPNDGPSTRAGPRGCNCGCNIAAIPLAAGFLNPLIDGAAMAASSVFVAAGSIRLRRFTAASPPGPARPAAHPRPAGLRL